MNFRQDVYLEKIAKKAAGMSRRKAFKAGFNIMVKAGMPYKVIERVLYEPHKIRASDYSK
jgi:hypothetical protein